MSTIAAANTSAQDSAPLLRLLGTTSGRLMSNLLRLQPGLATRLLLAPRRAVHATALFLQTDEARALSPEVLARTLLVRHPRDLLLAALPGCDSRLYKLLDRATFPAWTPSEYAMLNDVLGADFPEVSNGSDLLSSARVTQLHDLLANDPVTLRWLLPFSHPSQQRSVHAVLGYLRDARLLEDGEGLPPNTGEAGIARRVVRALCCASAPEVPFPVPAGWQRLLGVREVFEIGKRMQNCLRPSQKQAVRRILALLTGQLVLLYHPEENVLAEFIAEPNGLWSVGNVQGPDNADPPPNLLDSLVEALRAAGTKVLPEELEEALHTVLKTLHEHALRARFARHHGEQVLLPGPDEDNWT